VLTSPLGATLAEARWTPGEARLVAPEGERRYPGLDALAVDLVGEPLPIGALFSWLRGQPEPGRPSRALDGSAGFEQFGWRVDLARFADGRLRLSRDGRLRVELRLILDPVGSP
jgi:outer membrane lipoprotein LolB